MESHIFAKVFNYIYIFVCVCVTVLRFNYNRYCPLPRRRTKPPNKQTASKKKLIFERDLTNASPTILQCLHCQLLDSVSHCANVLPNAELRFLPFKRPFLPFYLICACVCMFIYVNHYLTSILPHSVMALSLLFPSLPSSWPSFRIFQLFCIFAPLFIPL